MNLIETTPEKLTLLFDNETELVAEKFACVIMDKEDFIGAVNLRGLSTIEVAQIISQLNNMCAILSLKNAGMDIEWR